MARLAAAALATAPLAARAHDVVDPERLQQALVEVARAQRAAHAADADPEALYGLGEKVEAIVDLLNQEVAAHGGNDLLSRLVADRLHAYGLQLRFSERDRRYAYDLAAFREYLERAPAGPSAPAAWYRLLARTFHDGLGDDPSKLAAADAGALAEAAAEEERFLRRYPADEKAREVQFFLAVDYYRLAKAGRSPQRARYRRLGREALTRVRERFPDTMEARAAETLLEDLARR
jgi:TolA-binding protein